MPEMNDSKKSLIIPMLVEAYASGERRPVQKNVPVMTPDYKTAMHISVLGQKNTPGPDQTAPPLEAGIHLHFVLPDAFTHAPSPEEDYPAVPDKFIVTRLWKDSATGKLLTKCTVIESSFISMDKAYKDSVTIPFFQDTDIRKKWRYLGRRYPAGKPPEKSGDYLDKLTAVGGGDIYFNAYYPNCKSVFGYHDDLRDIPVTASTKLTYYVIGFFSNLKNDPFAKADTKESFLEVVEKHRFSVPECFEICNSCILYGVINSIEWKGYDEEYCQTPTGRVNITFGNTSSEALSLAIKNSIGENADLSERMLTALQYELYDEDDKPDGNFKIDDEIHFQSFSRIDGDDEKQSLVIDKKEPLSSENGVGINYSGIIKSGEDISRLKRKLIYEKRKLHCVWEQYVLLYEDEDCVVMGKPSKNEFKAEMSSICANIKNMSDELEKIKQAYDKNLKNFKETLPSGVTCEKSAANPFYAMKDPVLLLSGDGINRTFAFGEDGRFTANGTLFCQTSEVTSSDKEKILSECFDNININNLHFMYSGLLIQTVLICDEVLKTVKALIGEVDIKGVMPSKLAVNTNPFNWTTLYMIWKADYIPTRTDENKDNTLEGWDFEYGDTNLVYKGGLKPEKLKQYSISGKIVLTPHAVKSLGSVVNRYAQIYEDDEKLKELAAQISKLSVVSQNLSGFSDCLSGYMQAFQFPIMGIGGDEDIVRAVELNAGNERQSISISGKLMPMRGGYVKITGLTVVSSFGQTQPLIYESYYNNCELDFAETVNCGIKDYGLLTPSFTVPARINADFISASNNLIYSSSVPETSPVCGIVIPEILNRRLLAYTADGAYIGMVKTVYRSGKPSVRWISSPELEREFEKLPIDNPYFKSFLKNLLTGKNSFFNFNALMDKYLEAKHRIDSLIWGCPLVLTRMKVNFEFYSLPEFSKRVEDFKKNNTYQAEKIRFTLEFGDMERVMDGLFGYFDDGDFSKMYTPFGYAKDLKGADISQNDGDRFFTLLTAPNLPVNIQTGILPVLKVYIDAAHTKIADELALSAEISPVLGSLGDTAMPQLPQQEGENRFKWYILDEEKYAANEITPAITSFNDTILMDGYLVKTRS